MRVWGTAGHVDHGKSSLVSALTGINPDRLKEERDREMTIDLGFAWFSLPDGDEIGIVDVPGHRDFIENMLAGVGGIDAVLFVIAADEGIMPQTREHLAIIDILQIKRGVIVLTKIDLIDDPMWLDLVEEDIRKHLTGTTLEQSEIIRVSSKMGKGLDDLKGAMSRCMRGFPNRADFGRPRLSIDRVFSISGFGTIVTGTLLDGHLRVGDSVEILPKQLKCRIRGLQNHRRRIDEAMPGSRTAVNLVGVNVEDISRGDTLVIPGSYRPSQRLDVYFRLVKDASGVIKHNAEVKFFVGAKETLARARVIGAEQIYPGQEGWLQLELSQPVVAVRGDHYILRRPSPGETLGGGKIIDPQPAVRYRRFQVEVIERFEKMSVGSAIDVVFQIIEAVGVGELRQIAFLAKFQPVEFQTAILDLERGGQIVILGNGERNVDSDLFVTSRARWEKEKENLINTVKEFHIANPLRKGIPREELNSRLKLPNRFFIELVQTLTGDEIIETPHFIALSNFKIDFDKEQNKRAKLLMERFAKNPSSPPSVKECLEEVGEDIFSALLAQGELIRLSNDVVFRKVDYDFFLRQVKEIITSEGSITVASFRDRFNTSRRYALAFLEYLDKIGITRREGDLRRLKLPQEKFNRIC